MDNNRNLLNKTINLAIDGIALGHGPFAALVAKDNKVIAWARNSVVLAKDPTAHAEILAIREASATLGTHDLSGCILYSSCEPCPMCLGAIYWSGIRKVIFALDRNDAAAAGFSDEYIYSQFSLKPGDRSIEFIKIADEESDQIFRKWNDYDEKTPY
jgi:tRNA(Arg) A34 adenosine deaminase TadA